MTDIPPPEAAEQGPASGDYVVVARRYRPQTFEELIGQQHVAQALSRAIASDRVGHAYLFTGARGVGKTSAARILAKALNCVQGMSPVPCNECEICQSISTGDDVDVLEIDGASNRGIDEIRQLRQNIAIRPSRSRLKIHIIDEVHMLTKEAFNALLKTLEEPPEHVKFIFATTEPNKIPVTILSRCQRYDFAGIEATAIQTRLAQIAEAEGMSVEPDALQILAMRAAGSMRDSQSLLEQLLSTGSDLITTSDVSTLLGIAPAVRLSQLVQSLVNRDAAAAIAQLDEALAEGAEVSQMVDQLLGYFRDVMTQSVGCDVTKMLYALPGQREEIGNVAKQLGVQTLLAIVQILDQTAARMRVSTHTRTLTEMAIVRICHLGDLDELATLIAQLKDSPDVANAPIAAKKNETVDAKPRSPESAPPKLRQSTSPAGTATSSATNVSQASSAVSEAPATDSALLEKEPEPARVSTPLTADNVEEVWKRALESLTGMLVDHAAMADDLSLEGDRKLTVSFPSKAYADFCDRSGNRSRLESALEQACGGPVRLVLQVRARTDGPGKPPSKIKSRRQQQAEMTAQPFVQKAMELFDGDPSRLRYVPPE